MIKIKKFETLKKEESEIISFLFGLCSRDVQVLLDFGFEFDYTHLFFYSKIKINSKEYPLL